MVPKMANEICRKREINKNSDMRKAYKLLAVAMALVLCAGLQSCHNTEQIPHGYPILFRCADITRAEATLDSLKANGFKVFAHFAVDGNASNFDKEVSYDKGSDVWGYENIEYWIPGATYNFKAFYPKNGYTLEVDNTNATQEYTISDFDITTQTDLLVAEATAAVANNATAPAAPETGNVVKFQFQHLLANVVIGIKAEISGVEVQSISLEGISQTGNYNNGSWSAEQTATITNTAGIPLDPSSQDYISVGSLLTIPQTINGSQKLIIKTNKDEYTCTIPAIQWLANTQYTYLLLIEQENIIFNEPSVEEWDKENATGSVIIK